MKEIHYVPKKESVIGASSQVSGKLKFEAGLRIKGSFQGEIVSGGDLIIEQTSQVKANIKVKSLQLQGSLIGNSHIEQGLAIMEQSHIEGDIKTSSLTIAQGASIKGFVSMIEDSDTLDIFSAKPEQLKKLIHK
ncbi:polymer-forming cytoskeletal protein [Entomospira entomophila]|uniref:Polymer-forming cytoskeletal protein n=1 Tax=Entomospira entomophila TaxID=2719988 RepID=A0A968GAB8_9SPIO|nr:polymer-forming cytoskeletal protein [Entomospira entomophilus]NIZ39998.1 polymer-forming cytoskeletal protein [Entomospira entomophilus]WDI35558.1 polymer-forming cytoskeletal protein [Entomospira entomophilus]